MINLIVITSTTLMTIGTIFNLPITFVIGSFLLMSMLLFN